KPANVLLQVADCGLRIAGPSDKSAIRNLQSAIPKITDFGLAKCVGSSGPATESGALLGTPGYLAPEQVSPPASAAKVPGPGGGGVAVRPTADVYALGAMLYELLTGRPPFRGETTMETVVQTISLDPVPPRRLNPGAPRDLETICLKCLEKSP